MVTKKLIVIFSILFLFASQSFAVDGDIVREPGSTNITTVGTIAVGGWEGTVIDVSDYTNLTVTSPITLTDDDIAITDADDDGSTKGAASFDNTDFNAVGGNVTIVDDGHAHTSTSLTELWRDDGTFIYPNEASTVRMMDDDKINIGTAGTNPASGDMIWLSPSQQVLSSSPTTYAMENMLLVSNDTMDTTTTKTFLMHSGGKLTAGANDAVALSGFINKGSEGTFSGDMWAENVMATIENGASGGTVSGIFVSEMDLNLQGGHATNARNLWLTGVLLVDHDSGDTGTVLTNPPAALYIDTKQPTSTLDWGFGAFISYATTGVHFGTDVTMELNNLSTSDFDIDAGENLIFTYDADDAGGDIAAAFWLRNGSANTNRFSMDKDGNATFYTGNFTLPLGGVEIGTPTGGNQGAGTINATAVYDDGVLLTGAGGGASISDVAYPTGWDGDTTDGASRNALFDKINTLMTDLEDDASPQLGANLDMNGKYISSNVGVGWVPNAAIAMRVLAPDAQSTITTAIRADTKSDATHNYGMYSITSGGGGTNNYAVYGAALNAGTLNYHWFDGGGSFSSGDPSSWTNGSSFRKWKFDIEDFDEVTTEKYYADLDKMPARHYKHKKIHPEDRGRIDIPRSAKRRIEDDEAKLTWGLMVDDLPDYLLSDDGEPGFNTAKLDAYFMTVIQHQKKLIEDLTARMEALEQ